jgi:Ser/Thr protein kinase RdoA (MazF antagonist)
MAMLDHAQDLPDDAAQLKALVASYTAEIAAHKAEIQARDLLIEKLKHQLAGLRRHRFGAKSEALDQLELLLEGEEIAAAADETKIERASRPEPKGQPKRKPLPDHLPRDEWDSGAKPAGAAAAS